jgi:hypothetical protein
MTRLAPLWQQNGTYPAGTDRVLLGALWPVGASTGGAGSAVAGTMNVSVAAGTAAVVLSGGSNYTALCRWDAAEVVTLTAGPPTGQTRIDLVVCQVRDQVIDAGSNNDFVFAAIAGAPSSGTPAAPTVPANAYPICAVTVPANAANLNAATIVDRRNPMQLAGPATTARCRVNRAGAFTTVAGAVVAFDTVSFDPLAMWSAGTSQITVPTAGDYLAVAAYTCTAQAIGDALAVNIRRNTVVACISGISIAQGATNVLEVVATDVIPCTAGDKLDVVTQYIVSGRNGIPGTAQTYFTARLLP